MHVPPPECVIRPGAPRGGQLGHSAPGPQGLRGITTPDASRFGSFIK